MTYQTEFNLLQKTGLPIFAVRAGQIQQVKIQYPVDFRSRRPSALVRYSVLLSGKDASSFACRWAGVPVNQVHKLRLTRKMQAEDLKSIWVPNRRPDLSCCTEKPAGGNPDFRFI